MVEAVIAVVAGHPVLGLIEEPFKSFSLSRLRFIVKAHLRRRGRRRRLRNQILQLWNLSRRRCAAANEECGFETEDASLTNEGVLLRTALSSRILNINGIWNKFPKSLVANVSHAVSIFLHAHQMLVKGSRVNFRGMNRTGTSAGERRQA